MRASSPLLALAALLAAACVSEDGGVGDLDGAVAFDGASLGTCAGEDYVLIPVADCPASGCIGSAAFALCQGTSYARCACGPPGGGWTLLEGGGLAQEASVDATRDVHATAPADGASADRSALDAARGD
jgi:hypothetical protein